MQITRTEPQSQSQRARTSTKSAAGGAYVVVSQLSVRMKQSHWTNPAGDLCESACEGAPLQRRASPGRPTQTSVNSFDEPGGLSNSVRRSQIPVTAHLFWIRRGGSHNETGDRSDQMSLLKEARNGTAHMC